MPWFDPNAVSDYIFTVVSKPIFSDSRYILMLKGDHLEYGSHLKKIGLFQIPHNPNRYSHISDGSHLKNVFANGIYILQYILISDINC